MRCTRFAQDIAFANQVTVAESERARERERERERKREREKHETTDRPAADQAIFRISHFARDSSAEDSIALLSPLRLFTGAFRLYDVDNDGFITRDEMYNIVDAIYQMVVSASFSKRPGWQESLRRETFCRPLLDLVPP